MWRTALPLRRLCPPLAVVLLALSLPAKAAAIESGDVGGTVDIGGRKLYLTCQGNGSPTVILISGYRNNAEIWTTPPVALPPHVPADFSPEEFEKAWRKGQNELVALLPDARHEIAEQSDHYIQVGQPNLAVDAVRAVVEAIRNPGSWRQ
jgi:hypothetical protein